MRIGLIARADYTGLGMQTHGFYRHMNPAKTLVIDLHHLNGQQNDRDRYPDAEWVRYTPYPEPTSGHPETRRIIDRFLDDLDIVFTCETVYDYHLIHEARRRGIKTVLQYNFEFLDHIRDSTLAAPDLFMAPSLWRYDDLKFKNKCFLPAPVDRQDFPFARRNEARTFLHVAGTPALEDRNGTDALVEAWAHVQSDSCLVIRSQKHIQSRDDRILVTKGLTKNHQDLYGIGDVFLMPRKFGGLCLPMNEALSCGMPVIMTDISPQGDFLPPAALVPATLSKEVMTKCMIDVYEPDREALAAKVDELAGDPALVRSLSSQSGVLGDALSWERLAPVYREVFATVLGGGIPMNPFTWPNVRTYDPV